MYRLLVDTTHYSVDAINKKMIFIGSRSIIIYSVLQKYLTRLFRFITYFKRLFEFLKNPLSCNLLKEEKSHENKLNIEPTIEFSVILNKFFNGSRTNVPEEYQNQNLTLTGGQFSLGVIVWTLFLIKDRLNYLIRLFDFVAYLQKNDFNCEKTILKLRVPCISKSCIEIKIKINFYFHTSL